MGIGINMKRKDSDAIDRFSHDFSDFSLSSPSRKIRRLDADLPPIMEEEEPEVSPPPPFLGAGPAVEDSELESRNRKAIVVFKPPRSLFFNASPSNNISLSVDSHLISGFKDQFIRARAVNRERLVEEDSYRSKECLAVVPWKPTTMITSTEQPSELIDAEVDSMEIEENNATREIELAQQWQQQQHCMIPQPYQSTSTPITWFSATKNHY